MTHTSTVNVVTALVHVHVCEYVLRQEPHAFDSRDQRKDFLCFAKKQAAHFEAMYAYSDPNCLSSRLTRMIAEFDTGLSDEVLIEISHGGTFYCVDSLTMTYGLFAQQVPSFLSIVKATTIGGDTDSNAAMLGALVGGLKGARVLDQAHIQGLYQSQLLRTLAEHFGTMLSNVK